MEAAIIEAPVGSSDSEDKAEVRMYDIAGPIGQIMLVIIMLAFDNLNPVKVLCSYTGDHFSERHLGYCVSVSLALLCYNQREHLVYFCTRLFFRCTVNNMFFQSVEVVGLENLPRTGPVILTGNHNNQFVDGCILLTNTHREISFMIAQKSFDRPLVGFLARVFHCMPVSRPQDLAFAGDGQVAFKGDATIIGQGTNFTKQVQLGSMLKLPSIEDPLKVKEVVSDTELVLEAANPSSTSDANSEEQNWIKYKILPKIDQGVMYNKVFQGLKEGKCLGIFPEGGSHDQTDILPLKAGVAIIALDAYNKHHMRVPIIPVGLNYFQGHKFGGRCVIEFGAPIHISDEIYSQHETDRRGATEAILQLVSAGMRSVIVPTPNYKTLELIYMARRLYVQDGVRMTAEETNDLNRRFAVGIQKLLLLARGDEARGEVVEKIAAQSTCTPPASPKAKLSPSGGSFSFAPKSIEALEPEELEAIEIIKSEIQDYMLTLKSLGIRDHQVRQIGWWSMEDLVGRLLYLLVAVAFAAMPQILFNLPVMYVAGKLAVVEQKKALAASSVKLAARDVVMSYKIIYVLVFIPIMYVIYTLFFLLVLRWSLTSVMLFDIAAPAFAFLGMKAGEQGVRNWRNLVPLLKRVMQQTRREQDTLPARRVALQRKLHNEVRKFGPRLGGLYTAKKGQVEWAKEMAELEVIANDAVRALKTPGLPKTSSQPMLSRSASGTALEHQVTKSGGAWSRSISTAIDDARKDSKGSPKKAV